MRLGSNISSSLSYIAESFKNLQSEARTRWPVLMEAMRVGSPIVSWLHPESVTLRAYMQLLVDRLRAKPCGPCVRSEKRKRKCRQPRCTRNVCRWELISDLNGCSSNADGTVFRSFRTIPAGTLSQCKAACEKDDFCKAVDFSRQFKKCHLFPIVCSRPMARQFQSFQIRLHRIHGGESRTNTKNNR